MEIYTGSSCVASKAHKNALKVEEGRRRKATNHMDKAQETERIAGMLISTKIYAVTSAPWNTWFICLVRVVLGPREGLSKNSFLAVQGSSLSSSGDGLVMLRTCFLIFCFFFKKI